MQSWIDASVPITDRLLQCSGDAQLHLVNQKWVHTDCWAYERLRIRDDQLLLREIIMNSHATPHWYAKTLIPAACYHQNRQIFDLLQQGSLKNILFDGHGVVRRRLWYEWLCPSRLEYAWAEKHVPHLKDMVVLRAFSCTLSSGMLFYVIELLFSVLADV